MLNNMTHYWCDICDKIQPASFEGANFKSMDKQFIGGDILCNECHFVIATAYTHIKQTARNPMPKRYSLSDYWLFYTAGMSISEIIKDILESFFKQFDRSRYYLRNKGKIKVFSGITNRLGIKK